MGIFMRFVIDMECFRYRYRVVMRLRSSIPVSMWMDRYRIRKCYLTLQFYAPTFMLLTLCDREPDRENEAINLLEKHFRRFSSIYGGTVR